jgi:hypothetical protein
MVRLNLFRVPEPVETRCLLGVASIVLLEASTNKHREVLVYNDSGGDSALLL